MTSCSDRGTGERAEGGQARGISIREHRDIGRVLPGRASAPCENIRDTDWQVFPGARENRSRNSHTPALRDPDRANPEAK